MNKYKYLPILLLLVPFTVLAERPSNNGYKPEAGLSDDDLINAAEKKKRNRMREGTQLTDTIGSFVQSGERWTFEIMDEEIEKEIEKGKEKEIEKGKAKAIEEVIDEAIDEDSASKLTFQVLENLMLERVSQTIENTTAKVIWKVDGKITEYRGNNFLILTYVVLNR